MSAKPAGKDFIFSHSSANTTELAVAIVRGALNIKDKNVLAASRLYS